MNVLFSSLHFHLQLCFLFFSLLDVSMMITNKYVNSILETIKKKQDSSLVLELLMFLMLPHFASLHFEFKPMHSK